MSEVAELNPAVSGRTCFSRLTRLFGQSGRVAWLVAEDYAYRSSPSNLHVARRLEFAPRPTDQLPFESIEIVRQVWARRGRFP
jgi:hypothetical protein